MKYARSVTESGRNKRAIGEKPQADGGHERRQLGVRDSAWIGAVQGLCLPFRGFSRSGATISTGLFPGRDKVRVEEFSFALAVVLTPAVILKEGSLTHRRLASALDTRSAIRGYARRGGCGA